MYYSHSKINEFEEVYGSKQLKDHINGVSEKALLHLSKNLNLSFDNKELEELVKIIVKFHDLGKYTSYFQNYLLGKEPIDQTLKRHAQIGGFVAYNYFADTNERKGLLALYIIFLHHSQLINILDISIKLNHNLERIIQSQISDLKNVKLSIENDLQLDDLEAILNYTEVRKLRKGFKYWGKKHATIQDYFSINYIFSLLIESDKLDASDTQAYLLKPISPLAVDNRFGKPALKNENLKDLSNNELRNYCRSVVVSHLSKKDILDHFIFTLTAPTGIGKTMTALDFSLKLKDKLRREKNYEARIIYGLPFINIIEQALTEYKNTLKEDDIKILGHYQYADIFGDQNEKDNDDGSEINYNQKLMAVDTWQADIVITSFVQFFETLISNRNKLLKKFNHFANAIIILDEVQTLRLDQMPLLGASLYFLSKYLKSRIILMTATRPKIFALAESEILNDYNEKVNPKELLTNYEEVFAVFQRTSIRPLLNGLKEDKEDRSEEFVTSIFSEKWNHNKSCLIVCNTVNRSVELHEKITDYLAEKEYDNPLYYLSTNIIPADRLKRINNIKEDISAGKHPILIATQVVEAGVDLDFDIGFRDIGPIDSIIQVAGRVNRNNDQTRLHSPIYIVDFDSKATQMVYGRLTYNQAKKSLKQQNVFKEEEYLKLVNEYFDGISDKSSFANSKKFFNSMKTLKYDAENKNEYPVSAFRIIEESNRYSAVFVEINKKATLLLEKYLAKIKNEISKEEFDRDWKLKFQQHIISVPKYLCEDLETVNDYEENILLLPLENIDSRYSKETGYNRSYQEENSTYIF
jgi:CRISPR-associated endonuclease/helicase Cas3